MKRVTRPVLILAALALVASAAHAAGSGLAVQAGGKLWLTGSSTAHGYHSNATRLDVLFESAALAPAASPAEAIEQLIRAGGVTKLEVAIPVAAMRSGKDGLDKNMSKNLLAGKHPEIRFVMLGYEVENGAAPGALTLSARGKLTVAGVEREIQVPIAAKREGQGLRMTGEVPLLMTQFGIKPPTMMMGALRTADQVVIHFDLLVGAGDSAATATRAEGSGQ